MPCENFDDRELLDKLVEVTLELDEIGAIADEAYRRLRQPLEQAQEVDRSITKENTMQVARRHELDKQHVHYGAEVTRRGLHDDLVKAVQAARQRKRAVGGETYQS